MTETEKLKLKKPAQDDFYNIDDHNGNADIIDSYAVSMDNEIKGLKQQDQSLSMDITNLKKMDTEIDSEIVALKTKDINHDTEISKLKTADIDLGKRIDGVSVKDNAQDVEIAALKTKDTSLSNDITALKAKDTSIDTEISKLKTSDVTYSNAIKAEAQMRKLTADSGRCLHGWWEKDILAECLALEGDHVMETFYANSTSINKPTNASCWGYIIKFGTMALIVAHDWLNDTYTNTMASNGNWYGWQKLSNGSDLLGKADKNITQLKKITNDAGGPVLSVANGVDAWEKIDELATGFHYITINTGAANSPYSSGYHVGTVMKPFVSTAYWVCNVTDYSTGRSFTCSRYNTKMLPWKEISTNLTHSGTTTPSNTLGADGDIYVQYI